MKNNEGVKHKLPNFNFQCVKIWHLTSFIFLKILFGLFLLYDNNWVATTKIAIFTFAQKTKAHRKMKDVSYPYYYTFTNYDLRITIF